MWVTIYKGGLGEFSGSLAPWVGAGASDCTDKGSNLRTEVEGRRAAGLSGFKEVGVL